MNEKLFSELMKSVEQAGAISRNEMKPKRQFLYMNAALAASLNFKTFTIQPAIFYTSFYVVAKHPYLSELSYLLRNR